MTAHRIGLLGGSFNPPHNAHLALALAALAQLTLDRVDFMPAGQPWQKIAHSLAPALDRVAMCQLAVEGFANLSIERCEIDRQGNTYTVDTLLYLTQRNPNTRYTLIIGADQAQRFDTWHNWQQLLSLCRLAVVSRNGAPPTLPTHVAHHCQPFDTVQMPALDISASNIRAAIAAGNPFAHQVPAAVERYIVKHSLYKHL